MLNRYCQTANIAGIDRAGALGSTDLTMLALCGKIIQKVCIKRGLLGGGGLGVFLHFYALVDVQASNRSFVSKNIKSTLII